VHGRECLILRSTWSYLCIRWGFVLSHIRFCICLLQYDYIWHIVNFVICNLGIRNEYYCREAVWLKSDPILNTLLLGSDRDRLQVIFWRHNFYPIKLSLPRNWKSHSTNLGWFCHHHQTSAVWQYLICVSALRLWHGSRRFTASDKHNALVVL
jgi:hypothetical protein